MTTLLAVVAAAAVLILALRAESLAQLAMRSAGGRTSVSGEVLRVERVTYGQGRHHGIKLLLQTATGRLSVQVGPSWFVDGQRMKVAPHDVISVAGSRVTCEGKPTLIATVIRKGNERLRLRAADGTPLWLASRAS